MGHHITPEIRKLIVSAKRRGARTKDIAKMFNVHRKTVWKWCKRAKHRGRESFKDKSKRPKNIKKKTTIEIENAIIVLREAFNWGTKNFNMDSILLLNYFLRTLFLHVEIFSKNKGLSSNSTRMD